MSRRDFVSMATMSALAVALTACGGGDDEESTGPVSPGTGQVTVLLADFPASSAVGATAKVRSSPAIAVSRTATGLVAFSLSCPHQGTQINIRSDVTTLCPNHDALSQSWRAVHRGRRLDGRTAHHEPRAAAVDG